MSVSSIMNIGYSALTANQSALRATSNNIANANTVGYARLDPRMIAQSIDGKPAGVQLAMQRVTDMFLTASHRAAISDASLYDTMNGFLDRAQAFFGDPSDGASLFSGLDNLFSGFGSLAADPSSSLRRAQSVGDLENMLAGVRQAYSDIDALRDEADLKVSASIEEANGIMGEIATLNAQIQRAVTSGQDPSGALTEQSVLVDRLSEILDVRIQERDLGGIEVRTTSGILLVDHRAAEIQRASPQGGERYTGLEILPPGSSGAISFNTQVRSGELRGLMTTRDSELMDLALQLGEFAGGLAESLNAASNQATAVPPPSSLTGRNTGLLTTDSLNFTGIAHLGVVGADGTVTRNIAIDFDAGTVSVAGGATTAFGGTIGGFVTALNTALGGDGSASFTDGQLSISATGADGIALSQDETTPSERSGRGFSHFFGLNDVVENYAPLFRESGVSGTDAHGFTAGDTMTLAIRNENGDVVRTVDYTVAGVTFDDVITDLNQVGVLGGYATATLNGNGELVITPANANTSVDVISDTTSRGTTNVALSSLFGLSNEGLAGRAGSMSIRDALTDNPGSLPTAIANLSGAAVGDLALTPGDGRGAALLQSAGTTSVAFVGFGALGDATTSITDYAGRLASSAGLRASSFESRASAATALKDEAEFRRSSMEGVNLDEEMVNMTVYQQGYSAASRLIQAAQDMYDTLMNMV